MARPKLWHWCVAVVSILISVGAVIYTWYTDGQFWAERLALGLVICGLQWSILMILIGHEREWRRRRRL